jgi:hypothetical protein
MKRKDVQSLPTGSLEPAISLIAIGVLNHYTTDSLYNNSFTGIVFENEKSDMLLLVLLNS